MALGATTLENTTLALLMLYKLLHVVGAWFAGFLATKVQQELYIDRVFLKRENPPPLHGMLLTYVVAHAVLSVVAYAAVVGLAWLLNSGEGDVRRVTQLVALDFTAELLATISIATLCATVMTKKKYFSYRYEGLRAIRAYREVLINITVVHGIMPYFLAAPQSWRA